jgi:hypothetical protein
MKIETCIEDAVASGIGTDWFWSEPCAEMYSVLSRYFAAHKTLCPYETYQSILSKVATGPDSVNDKMVFVQNVFAMHTSKADYPYLRQALVGRYAQKRVWPVLDKAYTDLAGATHGQADLVAKLRQDIAVATELPVALTAKKSVTAASLADADLGEVNWVIDGLLAEGAGVLGGRPKIGKSWLALQLGVAVSTGSTVFGRFDAEAFAWTGGLQCKQCEVLGLFLEDTKRRIRSRLEALVGADKIKRLENLHIISKTEGWRRLDCGGLDDLKAWHKAHPALGLVIIDTLQKIKPGGSKHQNAYERDVDSLSPLMAWAGEAGVCVLLIHHTTKKKGNEDPFDDISGSLGITGSMDTSLVLKRKRDSRSATLHATGRDVDDMELEMEFSEDNFWELLGQKGDATLRSESRQQIADALRALGGTATSKELVTRLRQSGVKTSDGGIRYLISAMGADGQLHQEARGRWSLPESLLEKQTNKQTTPTSKQANKQTKEGQVVCLFAEALVEPNKPASPVDAGSEGNCLDVCVLVPSGSVCPKCGLTDSECSCWLNEAAN